MSITLQKLITPLTIYCGLLQYNFQWTILNILTLNNIPISKDNAYSRDRVEVDGVNCLCGNQRQCLKHRPSRTPLISSPSDLISSPSAPPADPSTVAPADTPVPHTPTTSFKHRPSRTALISPPSAPPAAPSPVPLDSSPFSRTPTACLKHRPR